MDNRLPQNPRSQQQHHPSLQPASSLYNHHTPYTTDKYTRLAINSPSNSFIEKEENQTIQH